MKRKRLLTNSRMGCFKDCSERDYIRYELGYEPNKTAKPLLFGTCFHYGLEGYWNARKVRANNPLAAGLSMLDGELDSFDLAKLRIMMCAYSVVWDNIRCKVLGVEVPFEIPLTHPTTGEESEFWHRAGKIDLILELPDKRIALVEHKTTSDDPTPGGTYASRLTLDEQISYYSLAAKALGLKPDVIVYDVCRKPNIAPKTATENVRLKKDGTPYKGTRTEDETPEEYETRVLEVIQKDVGKYVRQLPVHRFDRELDRFHLEVWNQASVMEFAINNEAHTRNSHACARHYGSVCPYLDVCRGMARLTDTSLFHKLDDVHPELDRRPERT